MIRLASFPAGSPRARFLAVALVVLVVSLLIGATATGPWWYTWRAWVLLVSGCAAGAALVWAFRIPLWRGRTLPVRAAQGELVLERELIELLDQVPGDALRYRIRRALASSGVHEFSAEGELFDPARHHVADRQWTNDPAQDRRVARTLRPGFAAGMTIVRAADVLVYRATPDQ